MAIANGTCVSFCNQPGTIWLPQESLRHILTSPGYAPSTIAVNVTSMERGLNACQTHCSMYPSIFNRFPVIQPESSKVRHFSTFLHIFASPGYAPGTIAVNVTWMERGFNAGQTPRCICQSIFNHFWDNSDISVASDWFSTVLVSEWAFLTTFCFPLGTPLRQSR